MPRCSALLTLIVLLSGCRSTPESTTETISLEQASPLAREGKTPSSDGVQIAYSVEGEGDLAVLLIHGWSCDRTYWRTQIEPLAASYRVVTIDLAGHGDSGRDRLHWTLPAFGEDIRAVADELDIERAILVGHSMGAPAALEAAALMGDRILGVVAVDALHDVAAKADPEQFQAIIESYETDFVGTCNQFVRSMFLDTADPELVETTSQGMCGAPADIATALMSQFGDYDQAAVMAKVKTSIRAINSAAYPTNVVGNREISPNFEAEIIEGVGHFPMLVVPQELNRRLLATLADLGG